MASNVPVLKELPPPATRSPPTDNVPVFKWLPLPATRSPPTDNVPVLKWLPPPATQSLPTNYYQLLCNNCNDININDLDLDDLKTFDYNDLNNTVSNIKKDKNNRVAANKILKNIKKLLRTNTACKVSKYGPEITQYLDTFHVVKKKVKLELIKFLELVSNIL